MRNSTSEDGIVKNMVRHGFYLDRIKCCDLTADDNDLQLTAPERQQIKSLVHTKG